VLVLVLALLVLDASAMFTPTDHAVSPVRSTPPTRAPATSAPASDPVYYTDQRNDNYMLGSYGG
jgi:hypothetical protein